jgi:GH18 family chitinase
VHSGSSAGILMIFFFTYIDLDWTYPGQKEVVTLVKTKKEEQNVCAIISQILLFLRMFIKFP